MRSFPQPPFSKRGAWGDLDFDIWHSFFSSLPTSPSPDLLIPPCLMWMRMCKRMRTMKGFGLLISFNLPTNPDPYLLKGNLLT